MKANFFFLLDLMKECNVKKIDQSTQDKHVRESQSHSQAQAVAFCDISNRTWNTESTRPYPNILKKVSKKVTLYLTYLWSNQSHSKTKLPNKLYQNNIWGYYIFSGWSFSLTNDKYHKILQPRSRPTQI